MALHTKTLAADVIAQAIAEATTIYKYTKPYDIATHVLVMLDREGIRLTASNATRERLTQRWRDGIVAQQAERTQRAIAERAARRGDDDVRADLDARDAEDERGDAWDADDPHGGR